MFRNRRTVDLKSHVDELLNGRHHPHHLGPGRLSVPREIVSDDFGPLPANLP